MGNEDKFWGTVWALGIVVVLVGLSVLLWMQLRPATNALPVSTTTISI